MPLKMQVELCYIDTGSFDKCTSGIKADRSSGERGWDLSRSPESFASRYVSGIDVYRGVIIATAGDSTVPILSWYLYLYLKKMDL